MVVCTRRLEWDAMHRIPDHESKCKAFHGHRYVAEITCVADDLDDLGRVVDFSVIKEKVGTWIDTHWDHTAILMKDDPDPTIPFLAKSNAEKGHPVYWLDDHPTAENIVIELGRVAGELLKDTGVQVQKVRIWETPNAWAEWSPQALSENLSWHRYTQ